MPGTDCINGALPNICTKKSASKRRRAREKELRSSRSCRSSGKARAFAKTPRKWRASDCRKADEPRITNGNPIFFASANPPERVKEKKGVGWRDPPELLQLPNS